MKVIHFRPYTLHLGRYELSRGTMVLPLPRIAMEILILLVERRGDLLTRQEIAARVWPGSDPEDVFQSINTAINRIRSTLRDDAVNPRYVQTVIGKGYRFMAAVEEEVDFVEEISAPVRVSEAELAPVAAGHAGTVSLGQHLSSLSSAVSGKGAAAPFPVEAPAASAMRTETPIVSPTKRRWGWAAAVALLLASVSAWAVWQHIAAISAEHRGAFQLVQLTTNGADEPVTAGAISPDGTSLAYADRNGVLLRELSGTVRPLLLPGLVDVKRMEWFPDGRHILVSAATSSTHKPQIWSVATGDEAPRLIRDGAELGIPSPDGTRIAFTSVGDAGVTTFWISDTAGGNETRIDAGPPGGSYPVLLWTNDGRKLILEEVRRPSSATKADAASPGEDRPARGMVVLDIKTHRRTAALNGIVLGAACLWGKNGILFTGNVNDSRLVGLWRVDLDPETGAPVAEPVQVQLVENVLSLSRSRDGRVVAAVFSGQQPDVYVATLSEPGPSLTEVKRITFGTGQEYPHAWTSDSKSILFESNESAQVGVAFHVYQQALDGPAQPRRLVPDPMLQVLPQQSPDGRWVLFASNPRWLSGEPYALYRVPETGGAPVKVEIGGPLDEYRCPLSGKSCILRETEEHTAFHYYALDPVMGKGRLLCSTPWTESLLWDWNVSPDGTKIALPLLDPMKPRIRIVPCIGAAAAGAREIPVKVERQLREVVWAADSQGWFVSTEAVPRGADLFYVRPNGSATFLRHDDPLWPVPSPDGRKLAFVGETVDSNVWLLR